VNAPIARRLVAHGRVHGVGYRFGAVRKATMAELAGWVRNRHDGTVEVFVQGPAADVERFIAWCRHGPRRAEVTDLVLEEAALDQALAGFEQRATV
jgi:acylphosphatase